MARVSSPRHKSSSLLSLFSLSLPYLLPATPFAFVCLFRGIKPPPYLLGRKYPSSFLSLLPHLFTGRAPGVLKSCPSTLICLGVLSGFFAKSYVTVFLVGLVLVSGESRFYPSGCGGHKNLENAATFSKFLGREEKSLPRDLDFLSYSCALILSGICQEKFVRQKC